MSASLVSYRMRWSRIIVGLTYVVNVWGRVISVQNEATDDGPKRLAAYITNLAPDSSDVAAVKTALQTLLQSHLEVEQAVVAAPFQDPQVNSGAVFSFSLLNEGNIIVSDSKATPDAYNGYANKWKGALEYNPAVTEPIVVGDHEYYIDGQRFETTGHGADPDDIVIIDHYDEGLLADPTVDVIAPEVESALATRYQVMQVKLMKNHTDALAAEPTVYLKLIEDVRTAASNVCGVSASNIALFSLKDAVVQFTVNPATDAEVNRYAQQWAAALASEAQTIASVFNQSIDYTFPATALTGITTTPVPGPNIHVEDESSNAGVVVGAVAGGLCGAAAVGGAGFAWRKRRLNNGSSGDVRQPRFDVHGNEFSPGLSPNGLTNVDIRGELTPTYRN